MFVPLPICTPTAVCTQWVALGENLALFRSWVRVQQSVSESSTVSEWEFNSQSVRVQQSVSESSTVSQWEFNSQSVRVQQSVSESSTVSQWEFNSQWVRVQQSVSESSTVSEWEFNSQSVRVQQSVSESETSSSVHEWTLLLYLGVVWGAWCLSDSQWQTHRPFVQNLF